jgi:hypothetical protein
MVHKGDCVICSGRGESGEVAALVTVALVQERGITAVEAELCEYHRRLAVRTRETNEHAHEPSSFFVKKDLPS